MVYKLSDKDFEQFNYPSDVKRIVIVAAGRGVILFAVEANAAWEEHSDNLCAGWLVLPEDDDTLWSQLPAWARGESSSEDEGTCD
jgi:hypothetical protein